MPNRGRGTVRFIARVWSLASLAFVAMFVIGEAGNPSPRPPTVVEWLTLLTLFPGGVALGLILSWWRERLGGLLTLACLIGFYAVQGVTHGSLPRGPWFALVAAPGLLFLFAGRRSGRD